MQQEEDREEERSFKETSPRAWVLVSKQGDSLPDSGLFFLSLSALISGAPSLQDYLNSCSLWSSCTDMHGKNPDKENEKASKQPLRADQPAEVGLGSNEQTNAHCSKTELPWASAFVFTDQ